MSHVNDWEAEQTVAQNIDRLSTAEEVLQAVTSSDGGFTCSAKQVENTCADAYTADKSVEYPSETFSDALTNFGRTLRSLNQIVDNSMRRHEQAHEQYMQDVIGNCNGDE